MRTSTVPIRVPIATRDRIRLRAKAEGITYGTVVDRSLDAADREGFWERVGALRPDEAYKREFEMWDAPDEGDGRWGEPA